MVKEISVQHASVFVFFFSVCCQVRINSDRKPKVMQTKKKKSTEFFRHVERSCELDGVLCALHDFCIIYSCHYSIAKSDKRDNQNEMDKSSNPKMLPSQKFFANSIANKYEDWCTFQWFVPVWQPLCMQFTQNFYLIKWNGVESICTFGEMLRLWDFSPIYYGSRCRCRYCRFC